MQSPSNLLSRLHSLIFITLWVLQSFAQSNSGVNPEHRFGHISSEGSNPVGQLFYGPAAQDSIYLFQGKNWDSISTNGEVFYYDTASYGLNSSMSNFVIIVDPIIALESTGRSKIIMENHISHPNNWVYERLMKRNWQSSREQLFIVDRITRSTIYERIRNIKRDRPTVIFPTSQYRWARTEISKDLQPINGQAGPVTLYPDDFYWRDIDTLQYEVVAPKYKIGYVDMELRLFKDPGRNNSVKIRYYHSFVREEKY